MATREKSTEKLARYIMMAAAAAVILAFCWYFKNIIVYIILAAVVSLVGRPIKKFLGRIKLAGRSMPDWLLAILTIMILLLLVFGIVTRLIPVTYGIIQNISANMHSASVSGGDVTVWLASADEWLIEKFPRLGSDFKLETAIADTIKKSFSTSSITSMIGSVASTAGNIGIGIFSTIFISFFFIRDDMLFKNIVGAFVSDKIEPKAIAAIGDIEHLLTRYFVGILIEVLSVTLLNFSGLWSIARLDSSTALGIAFMTGLLNIIPYVGPWIGAAIGVILGLVLKYSEAAAVGATLNFLVVLVTLIAVFVVTQMIDNFLLQPFIYSTSIKSSPLEIFIVLLIAGNVGGIAGMLVAVPAYTVLRVIASRFFGNYKIIRRLIPPGGDTDDAASSPTE